MTNILRIDFTEYLILDVCAAKGRHSRILFLSLRQIKHSILRAAGNVRILSHIPYPS